MGNSDLRLKMLQALQLEKRMLAERRYLEALDARGEYRRLRRQLVNSWGDTRLIEVAV